MNASRIATAFVGAIFFLCGYGESLASNDQITELLATIRQLESRIASLERSQSLSRTALESSQPSKKAKDTPQRAYARGIPEPVFKAAPTAASSSPTISWNNFYAGVSLGAGAMPLSLSSISATSTSTQTFSASPDNSIGLLSDIFIGWNRQLGSSYVLGLQLEGSLSRIRNQHAVLSTFQSGGDLTTSVYKSPSELEWMASALIRIGWLPSQDNLIYLAGGWSYAALFNRWLDDTFSLNGPTAAIGWERRLGHNWSFRTEYRYAHFPSDSFNTAFSQRSNSFNFEATYNSLASANLHIVKAGFSYLTD